MVDSTSGSRSSTEGITDVYNIKTDLLSWLVSISIYRRLYTRIAASRSSYWLNNYSENLSKQLFIVVFYNILSIILKKNIVINYGF